MKSKIHILLLEDSEADAELEILELKRSGMELDCKRIDTAQELMDELSKDYWDIIISDYVMPTFNALEALKLLKKLKKDIPLIVVSGTIGEDVAVDTMKAGASDYIMKGNLQRLVPAVLREVRELGVRKNKILAEEELKKSEEKFRQIAENIEEAIWLRSKDLKKIIYISPAYEKIWGKSCQSLYDNPKSFIDSTHPDDRERVIAAFDNLVNKGSFDEEYRIIKPDGSIRWVWARTFRINDESGELSRFGGIAEDITKKKESKNRLEISLKEKETLLRELYHRTKNNMQIVSSMLYLQTTYTKDEKLITIFREISTRIDSIALIHQKLYSSKNLSKINLKEYTEELFSLIFRSFGITEQMIKVDFDMEEAIVLIDIATPYGLVINELVTNTLKYAFPDKRPGKIHFELKKIKDDGICIRYSDNGVGLPKDFDYSDTGTLGYTIVNGIINEQLRGHVEFNGDNGFSAQIQIQTNLYKERV